MRRKSCLFPTKYAENNSCIIRTKQGRPARGRPAAEKELYLCLNGRYCVLYNNVNYENYCVTGAGYLSQKAFGSPGGQGEIVSKDSCSVPYGGFLFFFAMFIGVLWGKASL